MQRIETVDHPRFEAADRIDLLDKKTKHHGDGERLRR